MHRHILAIIPLLAAQPLAAQSHRSDWVRRHSVAITANPAAADAFEDLEPLERILAGARVVHFGELSHGEGNASATRARLIRFLHQRLGFSVVVWEAGFYECHGLNELLSRTESTAGTAADCLWPFWAASAEIAPLFDYARRTWRTASPLLMAGFDLQFTGQGIEPRRNDLVRWFERADRALPPD